jgi:hypothetical protein
VLIDDSIDDENKTIEKIDKQDKIMPQWGMQVVMVTAVMGDSEGGGMGCVHWEE